VNDLKASTGGVGWILTLKFTFCNVLRNTSLRIAIPFEFSKFNDFAMK